MAPPNPIDDDLYPPFAGFPRKGIAFLKNLKKNNKRPWFENHKNEFEEFVKFPMQCLIAALGDEMLDVAPEIEFNPKRSMFRIYRDVRFSKNKAPYKTHVAASFQARSANSKTESPGLYVHIEPGEVVLAGGLYMPTSDQLKRVRKSIIAQPDAFLAVLADRKFKKEFKGIQGEKLQKAPLGFPKDHAMIDHLKHKQFFVYKSLPRASCLTARFPAAVAGSFSNMMPLVRWLMKATG